MKEALHSDTITLKMCRYPSVFFVELSKTSPTTSNGKFGIRFERPSPEYVSKAGVSISPDSMAILRVTDVNAGGLLDESNKAKFAAGCPHLVVTSGMYIEAANTVSGSADAIAEELKRCTSVRIRIRRRRAD